MRKDRLRKNTDEIRNLEDIIGAHDEHTSHISQDNDALGEDLEIPEDIDVDDALTFPHPKHTHKTEDIQLMGTPDKNEVESEWNDSEMQPTDYEDHYDEAIDQYATDDLDEVVEEKVHHMGQVETDSLTEETPTDVLPSHFSPTKEDEEQDRR